MLAKSTFWSRFFEFDEQQPKKNDGEHNKPAGAESGLRSPLEFAFVQINGQLAGNEG